MEIFKELENKNLNITKKEIHQQKLELDINDILDNDIIFIHSGTATGKTEGIAKLSKELKNKTGCCILSVVNLISLSKEQIGTFKRYDTELNNYQTQLNNFSNSDGVICINSLYKLNNINFDVENTILYIDEVNDIIEALTQNDALEKVLKLVYNTLINIIKNCKKIIFTDATINENTLNLISSRTSNTKTLLIKNNVKKYDKISTNEYLDEQLFLNKVRSCIKDKEYFLFGCDGCERVSQIYNTLLSEFNEQKENFIIFTSREINKVDIANEQFKNKYVFYSPSITTGVSFVLKDVSQTQFIYITKTPQIKPISIFQMSCRTRNMKELNFYSSDIKPQKPKLNTLSEVETHYKTLQTNNNKLLNISLNIDENDNMVMVNNTFFKIFCYSQYEDIIYRTGYIKHYKNLLENAGFNIKTIGLNSKTLTKTQLNQQKQIYNEIKETKINEFVNLYFDDENTNFKEVEQNYKPLVDKANLLNISTKDEFEKYKEYMTDPYKLESYYNSLNLFKTNEYIEKRIKKKQDETLNLKLINNSYSKIKLLEYFENHYKIKRFNFEDVDINNEIDETFKELYASIFPKRKPKNYKDKQELLKIYVNIIKSICGEITIITQEQKMKNKKRIYEYNLNIEIIKELIILCKMKNPTLKGYNLELIEKLTGIKPELTTENNIYFGDDDEDEENKYKEYLFKGK